MATPVSFWGATWNDNTVKRNGDPESASTEFAIVTLTAANIVAQTALLVTLKDALNAISIGQFSKETTTAFRGTPSTVPAGSTLSQRENKYLIRYHDSLTNRKYRGSIPCADLSLLPDGSEFLDLTTGEGADVKAAFEAVIVSPDNTAAAVVVDSIQFVGRNT